MTPEASQPSGDEAPAGEQSIGEQPTGDQPTDRQAARVLGWIFIGAGLAIGSYTIGWPLYLAHTQAPEISISLKETALPILLLILGAAEVVGLKTFGTMFEDEHHITFFDVVRLLALGALGVGIEYLLKRHIESLGYYFPL